MLDLHSNIMLELDSKECVIMEIRELKYFLAITREQNISKAAEMLYMTQPSLSRQMQKLEKEIGKQLFVRGNKKITLTDAGLLLRKRAEEILSLYEKTQAELSAPPESISGDIYIGGGESYAVETVAKAAKELYQENPDITFHFFSGDACDVNEKLSKGLIDFGILVEPTDLSKYDFIRLSQTDTWGILMRKDNPLAEKEYITPKDLHNVPIIRSKQTMERNELFDWFQQDVHNIKIVATYNLMYNASILAKEGLGCVFGLSRLINTTGDSELCFRPLKPKIETSLAVVWKKYQVLSKPAEKFLEKLQKFIKEK